LHVPRILRRARALLPVGLEILDLRALDRAEELHRERGSLVALEQRDRAPQRAVDAARGPRRLVPAAGRAHDAAAMIYFNARGFDEAAARGRAIAELDAYDPRGFEHQVLSLASMGQAASALALVDEGLRLSKTNIVFHLA